MRAQAWFFQASCYQPFTVLAWLSFFTGYPIFDAQSQLVVPRPAFAAGWPAIPPVGG
ncbi:hypothetical protein EMIT0P12_70060 [Pseudomonas sp. IT-P12]